MLTFLLYFLQIVDVGPFFVHFEQIVLLDLHVLEEQDVARDPQELLPDAQRHDVLDLVALHRVVHEDLQAPLPILQGDLHLAVQLLELVQEVGGEGGVQPLVLHVQHALDGHERDGGLAAHDGEDVPARRLPVVDHGGEEREALRLHAQLDEGVVEGEPRLVPVHGGQEGGEPDDEVHVLLLLDELVLEHLDDLGRAVELEDVPDLLLLHVGLGGRGRDGRAAVGGVRAGLLEAQGAFGRQVVVELLLAVGGGGGVGRGGGLLPQGEPAEVGEEYVEDGVPDGVLAADLLELLLQHAVLDGLGDPQVLQQHRVPEALVLLLQEFALVEKPEEFFQILDFLEILE